MEKLGLNEIRRLFREFYVSKDHYPAKSASLIPQNDKSLLITNSGMAPLKPYFAGLETPPAKRMTTCQKCIRTGDIDNVGKTSRHGTFFEMLGNFSFGDYFKEQSLTWGWEFIKDVLHMPEDKVWATVFENDDEAVEIWKKLGMPEERIVRLGKDDNFWEIGLGPCGPCSEIYFDRGEKYGCGKEDCKPGCECDRYIEFWNHVFTQFSKEEDGSYSNLEHPNIDTGMGLERLACIMQGVDSIFDIDTIRYILDGVVEKSGVEYKDGEAETDISIRIVTDHLRSVVFMIADGIQPSNEGRGYVLRRLIRRAARHGKILGIKETFLSELAQRVINISGEAYPELVEKAEYIKKIIKAEEDSFASTLDRGCEIIGQYIEQMKEDNCKVLDGEKTFKLYDTYGFPLEVTEEILEEEGFTCDVDGFNAHMQAQKELARSGRKSADEEGWKEAAEALDLPKTEFTGYTDVESDSKVLKILSKDGIVEKASEGETVTVYLDKTPFYAEGGGQIYDNGFMSTGDFRAEVLSVSKSHDLFAHKVSVISGEIAEGDTVHCNVDYIRRNSIRRNHTATHLLQKALRDTLGTHVEQAGSSVDENNLRFDFTHFEALTKEELQQVENIVNLNIAKFLPVTCVETTMDEAQKMGAMALFGEKYGNTVRVVNCGDFSVELCGGTHVDNTGQIGMFKIMNESSVASGVRRIEAKTGFGVLQVAKCCEEIIDNTAKALKCNASSIDERSEIIVKELKEAKKDIEELKKASIGGELDSMIAEAKQIGDVKLITKRFDDFDINDLRGISDEIKASNKGIVMVFAAVNEPKVTFMVSITDDLVEKGMHAGKMIKEIAKAAGGGGGGKADMAQAGAKDSSKISSAFAVAESLIQ